MQCKWLILIATFSVMLAACSAPAAPSIAPTLPSSVLPTQPPSPLPSATKSEVDEWADAPTAALNARADLAQRLNVDPDTISLVSVEHVEWPDGCLGIQQPGVMCIMVITPGYKVVLGANGKQYEYHTNESGSAVKLATEI
jgi:hypothetical protein